MLQQLDNVCTSIPYRVFITCAILGLFNISTESQASNGSFLRTGGGVTASAGASAHSFPPIVNDSESEAENEEPLARAETSATTNTGETLAFS